MQRKRWRLWLSLGIACALMGLSYASFGTVDPWIGGPIGEVLSFPAALAGAFAFGSGMAAMWVVLLLETLLLAALLYALLGVIGSPKNIRH